MMFRRIIYIWFIFLLTLAAAQMNCPAEAANKGGSGPEQLLAKADQSRNSLLASSAKMNLRQNWLNCIAKYQEVYDKYPKSEQAPKALYGSASLYRKLYKYSRIDGDLDQALNLYGRLVEEYKDNRLADDAQYQRGEIYYKEKNDSAQAYVEFLKLDVNFPSGDMRPKGKAIMDELSSALSKKEVVKEEKTVSSPGGLVSVKNIRYWSTPTYTRIVIDAESPVKFTSALLKADMTANKPRRLYLDLENSRVSSEIVTDITIKDGLLKGARAGQYNTSVVRVVLDIDNIGEYKIFPLYDPYRIVVDVQGTGNETGKEGEKQVASAQTSVPGTDSGSIPGTDQVANTGTPSSPAPVAGAAGSASSSSAAAGGGQTSSAGTGSASGADSSVSSTRTPRKGIYKPDGADQNVSLARQLGLTVKRIVIDPGHGGKDPGTQLNGGIQEKDITLDLAKRLAASLKKTTGCEVLLTRDKDVFLPLDERTAFANVNKADLFISIHVNAHKQSSVYGLETYFLNMATDESAVIVAARENATSEKNISDLQSILNDLMLNTKISESSKLAYKVQNGMMSRVRKTYKVNKSLGVKQAPFYVLIGAEMPAILVETGFITNPTEKKRLLNDSYKNLLTDGIASGINSYIKGIEQAKGG